MIFGTKTIFFLYCDFDVTRPLFLFRVCMSGSDMSLKSFFMDYFLSIMVTDVFSTGYSV